MNLKVKCIIFDLLVLKIDIVLNEFWTKISKSSHCDVVYILSIFLKMGPNIKYHLNFGNLSCLVVLRKFSHMHGSAFFYTLPAVLKLSSHWKTHTTCLDAAAKLMLYVLIPDALNIHISMSSNLHNVILLGCVLAQVQPLPFVWRLSVWRLPSNFVGNKVFWYCNSVGN